VKARCRTGRGVAALALLASVLLAACGSGATVEEQVRDTIGAMESAAEEGRPLDFMAYVADDFQGQGGQLTRQDFLRLMTFQISRYRRLHAQLFPIEVTDAGGGFADARFRVLVTGGQGLLPEDGQLYRVETSWTRDGGDWLLWRATWEPVLR
jgi:hypothetical protein